MPYQSARHYLGLPVIRHDNDDQVLGLIEAIAINPRLMTVDGFLIGRMGSSGQDFLPRECLSEAHNDHVRALASPIKKPASVARILGLQAWTTQPKFLVGFVYDLSFRSSDGTIESLVIHQLVRTWRIPASAVEKITPRTLLINNDTTIKLKLTPYESFQ